jgi:hypothetical protein
MSIQEHVLKFPLSRVARLVVCHHSLHTLKDVTLNDRFDRNKEPFAWVTLLCRRFGSTWVAWSTAILSGWLLIPSLIPVHLANVGSITQNRHNTRHAPHTYWTPLMVSFRVSVIFG